MHEFACFKKVKKTVSVEKDDKEGVEKKRW